MLQRLRMWVFGKLQVKIMLLIVSVMLLLLTIFMLYDLRVQRQTLEAALLAKAENMALTGATTMGYLFEDALATGRFSESELFDTDYQPVPTTDPPKYHTAYDGFTDAAIMKIQDAYLEDADVLFAVTVDRNGYLPTHNSRYAQPLTGEYDTDLVGNRTKRIFDDPVGLAAAENTDETLQQIYYRDTGEVAWDISAPIWVSDRHWGGFRVAISLATIDAHLAGLNWRIGMAAVLLAAAMGLAAFLIARQIARPVQELAQVAKQVGRGELDVQVEVKSKDEIGQLARTFNDMAAQIRNLIDTLQKQSAAQIQQLETVAALTEQLNAILDFDSLLLELVDRVKESFDYYHAQVYTIDESQQNLLLAAGAGEVGSQLTAQSHRIPLSSPVSLVARAGRTGQVASVDNVRQADDWRPNPLLPDTYAEMAVPIVLEGQVLGVLDVQQDKIAGLGVEDANLLRSLASQVAVAIRNVRLLAEVEGSLAEARAAQERYLEQAWEKSKGGVRGGTHLYVKPDSPDLPEPVQVEATRQALRQRIPVIVTVAENGAETRSIVAPVAVGNRTIGTLQLHHFGGDDDVQQWTDEDLALVKAVIDQVAQTAETLRLFDETRERAGREHTIREITDKLRAAPNLDRLLETAARELGQQLGVPHTVLEFGLEANGTKNGE